MRMAPCVQAERKTDMNRCARAGLLPLYLKLYDETMPERRQEFLPFLRRVKTEFEQRGIDIVEAPISRLESEFAQAVSLLEDGDVDCIVTLHLAYSPSMECIGELTRTDRPILVLNQFFVFHCGYLQFL